MLFHLFDGLQCVCNSLVRGMGFQRWGLLFNFVTYGLGVPTGWCLAFLTDLGVLGLWLGPTIGTFTGCVCQLTFLFCMDWHKAAREASARLDHGKVTLHDVGEPATDTEAAAEAEETEQRDGDERSCCRCWGPPPPTRTEKWCGKCCSSFILLFPLFYFHPRFA
eukprot:PhM_4_TR5188/c0_g1_i9/m.99168/K03327/TC.MATE, SLC47A, norM, mdtK, dinF; multidrug resistance protein, MATE family